MSDLRKRTKGAQTHSPDQPVGSVPELLLGALTQLVARPDEADELRKLLDRVTPPGTRLLDPREWLKLRRQFDAHVRQAGRPFRAAGWAVRGSGLALRTSSNHWGHIQFRANAQRAPLAVDVFAGCLSPFLLKNWNHVNPERPPATVIATHVPLIWQMTLEYSEQNGSDPRPFRFPDKYFARAGVRLGPRTATTWLSDALDQIVPRVGPLCSDEMMRDWLLSNDRDNVLSMRMAAMLTKNLGLVNELPIVLDLAKRAEGVLKGRLDKAGAQEAIDDRKTARPEFWSHARFVQFLDELDPGRSPRSGPRISSRA